MSSKSFFNKLSIYLRVNIRKIRSSTERWHKTLRNIGIITVVGFIANILGIGNEITIGINKFLEDSTPKTVLVQSRLIPFISKVDDPKQHNQAFLQIQLRNIGKEPLLLTGAKINIKNSTKARIGIASTKGKCSLSSNVGIDSPVNISPGKAKWLNISPAIKLPGIENWLKKLNPKQALSNVQYVDSLNYFMSQSYGRNAYIDLELIQSPNHFLRSIKFHLDEGETPFKNGPKLDYNSFINSFLKKDISLLSMGHINCGESRTL